MGRRPSLEAYLRNWRRSDLPLLEKIRVAARNNAIKLRTGSACCGNHGEPGC